MKHRIFIVHHGSIWVKKRRGGGRGDVGEGVKEGIWKIISEF